MTILLDTCTFLWLSQDAPQLSDTARTLFQDPATEVLLSSVSAWEIAVKYAAGRLSLAKPPEQLVPEFRADYAIGTLPFSEEEALAASRLPPLHKDPFDRMLVSQAILYDLTILTPDAQIRQYPVRTAW